MSDARLMSESEMREHLKERLKDVNAHNLTDAVIEVMSMPHDYGTVCVAIGAIAAAAARAASRTPNGGITGFQACAVFWEFERAWGAFGKEGPKRMICYHDMLYPQYAKHFEKQISADTMKWLTEQAIANLNSDRKGAHTKVVEHWKSLAAGKPPFGFTVVATD